MRIVDKYVENDIIHIYFSFDNHSCFQGVKSFPIGILSIFTSSSVSIAFELHMDNQCNDAKFIKNRERVETFIFVLK